MIFCLVFLIMVCSEAKLEDTRKFLNSSDRLYGLEDGSQKAR